MKAEMNQQAAQYIRQNKNRKRIVTVVAALSVLVALMTTYVLILPGITMEYDMTCGQTAHQHTQECYTSQPVCGMEETQDITVQTVTLTCDFQPHQHTSECSNREGVVSCGISTDVFHTHNDFCYDGDGKLLCTLQSQPRHIHGDGCYQSERELSCQLEASAGHQHTEACKGQHPAAEPACGLPESDGHAHSDQCWTSKLSCAEQESAGHVHEESCYQNEAVLNCTLEANPGHIHDESCNNELGEGICGKEEGEGSHAHSDACYTQQSRLVCGKAEGEGAHAHDDACYSEELTCSLTEGEGAHQHDESCYPLVDTILCGLTEGQGAHTHTDECYTTTEQLICTLLHKHESSCFRADANDHTYAVCGMEEVEEHQHSESCRTVTETIKTGHTHTPECYGNVLSCGLEAHEHTDTCYPEGAVVATATPEVTAEPTATPEAPEWDAAFALSPQPTDLSTEALCGIPEHRHSQECLDDNGALVCGYSHDHTHGELCFIDLTDAVFYCGKEEHLHGYLCFDEHYQVICGYSSEHRHSYECLEDSDSNRYQCGKEEHSHSHGAEGGLMLLSLDGISGCYDENGNLICGLEEHTHSSLCNTSALQMGITTLEQKSGEPLQLSDYITAFQAVENKAEYDASTGDYNAQLLIKFSAQNRILMNNSHLVFDLPEDVKPIDLGIALPLRGINDEKMGEYRFVETENGQYQIQITILDDYLKNVNETAKSDGTLSFAVQLGQSLLQDDNALRIPTGTGDYIIIPENNITYPNQNERPNSDISSSKWMSRQEGNCLYYTVKVSTNKGTPGEIKLVDTLNITGIGAQVTVDSIKEYQNNIENGSVSVTPNIQNIDTGKQIFMTLPQLEANSYYEIVYKVELDNPNSLNVEAQVNNSVAVSSPETEDPDIQHTTNSGTVTYKPNVLGKTGAYDSTTDTVKWTITVNKDGLNIAGYILTDPMFSAIVDNSLQIKDTGGNTIDASNYTIQEDGSILFNGQENKNTYIIEYQTKPTQDFAGEYAEKNSVALQKDSDKVEIKDIEARIDRSESMSKEKGSAGSYVDPENADQKINSWINSITIPERGLSENLVVTDEIQKANYQNLNDHFMTAEQAQALYQSLVSQDWFGAVVNRTLVLKDENGTEHSITDASALDSLSGKTFVQFSYELDYTALNNSYRGEKLTYDYQTTAVTKDVQAGSTVYFFNVLKVNEKQVSQQYEYRKIQITPVQKYGTSNFNVASKDLQWKVQICLTEDTETIVVTDTLPAQYVELNTIVLPMGNGTLTVGNEQESGIYALVFTDSYASGNNEMNADFAGTYNKNTGVITLNITKNEGTDSRFFKQFDGNWDENAANGLINLEFNCKVNTLPDADQNKQIKLTNTVGVVTNGKNHGTASHTYETTMSDRVVKKDKYGSAADETQFDMTDKKIHWTVEVYQDRDYKTLIITDTLPEGLVLDRIETGSYGSNTKISPNGDGLDIVSTDHYHDVGVFTATYDADSRQITVNADISEALSQSDRLDGQTYGAGKTLKMTVYCTVTDDYIYGENSSSLDIEKQFTFKNEASVQVTENDNENPVNYGSDDQTSKGTIRLSSPVKKTDLNRNSNESSTTNQNGEVGWLVEIKQQDDYDKIIITDTLPTQVELTSIQILHPWWNNYITVATAETTNGSAGLVMDDTKLSDLNLQAANATYDPATGRISIELSQREPNGQKICYGKSQTLTLRYNCKLKDSMLPNVGDGQLTAGPYGITNQVTVQLGTNGETYVDSQKQNVTVDIPFSAGQKSYDWNQGDETLYYVSDINPYAMDLNPQGEKLTLEDRLSFDQNDPTIDINLMESSVKLYYADYDQYGNPVFDENGRLTIGKMVPFTEWEMSYEESSDQYNPQKKYRAMKMRVPDGKALVLVYEYRVSMPNATTGTIIPTTANTVTIKEKPEYSFSTQTNNQDTWYKSTSTGNIFTSSYVINKYDANNKALRLQGTEFDVYGWDGSAYVKLYSYTSDEKGSIILVNEENDSGFLYSENTAYYVVETKPTHGYLMPEVERKYYFYWHNANNPQQNWPEGFVDECQPVDLSGGAVLDIANTKESTFVAVRKEWKDASGNPMTDNLPDSVTVNLKRYAVPNERWKGAYNGGEMTSETVNVSFELNYGGSKVEQKVPISSTVMLTVTMKPDNGNFYRPNFPAPLRLISSTETEEQHVYVYTVKADKSITISDFLYDQNNNKIDNWGIANRSATLTIETEGGVYIASSDTLKELEPYKDHSYGKTQQLYAAGDWYASWDNLDIKGTVEENGEKVDYHYKYYIEEIPVDGFASTISGGSNDDGGSFVITNTKDNSSRTTTSIKVQKKWLDKDGAPVTDTSEMPEIEVQLYRTDLAGNETQIVDGNGAGITLNQNSNWEYNYKGLPFETYVNGVLTERYTYRVTEVVPEGYSVTFEVLDSNGNPVSGSNANAGLTGGTVMLINSAKPTTDVTVVKQWEGGVPQDDVQVEMVLSRKVYQNGVYEDAPIGEGTINTTITLPETVDGQQQWSHTWTGLPANDGANSYQYDVTETKVTIANEDVTAQYEQEKTTANGVITITNKTGSVALTLQKRWQDANGQPVPVEQAQSVYIKLFRNGVDVTGALTSEQVAQDVLVLSNGESYIRLDTAAGSYVGETSIVNLERGEGIMYTVKEYLLENGTYTEAAPQVIYNNTDDAMGMTASGTVQVINTREEPLTSIKVTKQWKDANGNDLSSGMPDSVQFDLWRIAEGTPAGTVCVGCGADNVNHLAACGQHYTCQNGYDQTAHEKCSVCQQYLCTSDHSGCNDTVSITFVAVQNHTENGATTSKRFERKVGNIPRNASVTWNVHTSLAVAEQPGGNPNYTYLGNTYGGTPSGKDDTQKNWKLSATFTATESGEAVHTFTTSQSNQEATITHEVIINGTTYSLRSGSNNGVTIPEGAEKVQDSPYSIAASQSWQTTIDGLPAVDEQGNPYRYYVEEVVPAGFIVSYDQNGVALDGSPTVAITNTQEQSSEEPETTQLTVSKQWQDENGNPANPAQERIQFKLYRKTADGQPEVVQEDGVDKLYSLPVVVTGQWQMTIDQLPAKDEQGNPYTYYVVEEPVDGYAASYNKPETLTTNDVSLNAGAPENGSVTITNKALPTITVSAAKEWKTADGQNMTPPDGATVALQLYRNTLTKEQWDAFVAEQQSGGDEPEQPGGDEPSGDYVTLTFNLVNTNGGQNNQFGTITYRCPINQTITLRLTYTGTSLVHYFGLNTADGHVGSNSSSSLEMTLTSKTTSENRIYDVSVSAENGAYDPTLWTITDSLSTQYNLRSATATDCSTVGDPKGEAIGSPVTLPSSGNWNHTWEPQVSQNGDAYYYYYVRETNPPSGYTPSYAYTWDKTTGNYTYTVTNTQKENTVQKTGSLTVEKRWVDRTPQSTVQFNVYQIARPKTSAAAVDWVPVTFTIKAPYGEQFHTVTQYFPENASVTWKPKWTIHGANWCPSNSNENKDPNGNVLADQNSVTYNGAGNFFSEGVKQENWCDYTFNIGSIGAGGQAVWTTDYSGYKNNYATQDKEVASAVHYWTNEFSVDGENDKVLYGTYELSDTRSIEDLLLEDEQNTYRYVVEEVGTGYLVSYDYSGSGDTAPTVTMNNYIPKKLKLKLAKEWADAEGKAMSNTPDDYYISYQLIREGWVLSSGELRAGVNKTWEVDITDAVYENCQMMVKEVGVFTGNGTNVTDSYTVEYSLDGINWQSAPTWATPDDVDDTTLYIRNKLKPTYVLPETGGTGTHWYTGVGALLTGTALVLLYRKKKRKRGQMCNRLS